MFLKRKILNFIRKIIGIDQLKQEFVRINAEQLNRTLKILTTAILHKDKDKIFY